MSDSLAPIMLICLKIIIFEIFNHLKRDIQNTTIIWCLSSQARSKLIEFIAKNALILKNLRFLGSEMALKFGTAKNDYNTIC